MDKNECVNRLGRLGFEFDPEFSGMRYHRDDESIGFGLRLIARDPDGTFRTAVENLTQFKGWSVIQGGQQ